MDEFLRYLVFGGGSIAVVSFFSERWEYFQSLKSSAKQFYSFLASAAIGIGAYALMTYAPIEVINSVTPYFTILSSVFGVYYLGQVFHKEDKLPYR